MEEAALNILEPEHLDAFELHLEACDECQESLERMRKVVGLLPFACDDAVPGDHVRTELLARLHDAESLDTNTLASPEPAMRPRRAIMSSIVAAALIIALWGAWSIFTSNDPGNGLPGGNIQVMAMERNCDDCDDSTGGHIGADLEHQDGVLIAWNLDPEQKHSVWCLKRNGERVLVSELSVARSGSVMQKVQFPEAIGSYDQIYVERHDGTQELSVKPLADNREDSEHPDTTPSESD